MATNKDNSLESQFGDVWSAVDTSVSSEAAPSSSSTAPPAQQTPSQDFAATTNAFVTAQAAPQAAPEVGAVSLAGELIAKNYHPVMIFGTRASGKSSLLTSLFHYLQTDSSSQAMCILGEWIIPIDTTYGQSVADAAKRFFNQVVMNFNDGNAAPSTRDQFPFYIPIILRPSNGQPEIRLAFLESRGEWYQVDKSSSNYFPELRDEVAQVYKNYSGSLSILLIAPYVTREAYTQDEPPDTNSSEIRDSDKGLFGALQAYHATRLNREQDKFMFVLTKWDAHTRAIVAPEFSNPPSGLIERLIHERFPLAWNLYQTMPKNGNALSMQYSSGVMSGDARLAIPEPLKPIMNQFPRALWGWLYRNASGGQELYTKAAKPKKSFFSSIKDILT